MLVNIDPEPCPRKEVAALHHERAKVSLAVANSSSRLRVLHRAQAVGNISTNIFVPGLKQFRDFSPLFFSKEPGSKTLHLPSLEISLELH